MRDDKPHVDALLRHLGCFHDLRDFPRTSTEKLALVRIADARGLITWRRARARYELTHFGWNELLPRRRFGVASLMVSAALGGIVGAIALAVFWLPADERHRSTRGQPSGSISRMAQSSVLQASPLVKAGMPSAAPLHGVNASPDASPAVTVDPEPSEEPAVERPKIADQTSVDQPRTKAAFKGVKQTTAKKSRYKTARRHRREQGVPWAYAGAWRGQQFRYAGYSERGAWLGYR
jgi:hypothetical protein